MKSPYTISLPMQIRLCTWRGFRRLKGDMSNFIAAVLGNTILAVINGESSLHFGVHRCLMVGVGSVFYNLGSDTGSFFSRGALPFFAILMNAFSRALGVSFISPIGM